MTHTVTVEQLQDLDACPEQVQLFFETFGPRAEVTPDTLARALAVDLNLGWLARRVLSPPVLASLTRTTDAAWAEYIRVTNAARAGYRTRRVANAALAEYVRVRDAAIIALFLDDANWKEVDA